jgi:hypothetical protein
MNVGRFFKQLVTLPWSESGRRMRIDKLIEETGEERDVCAAIIYARDQSLGREFSCSESADAQRIVKRLENKEITLPAGRNG